MYHCVYAPTRHGRVLLLLLPQDEHGTRQNNGNDRTCGVYKENEIHMVISATAEKQIYPCLLLLRLPAMIAVAQIMRPMANIPR